MDSRPSSWAVQCATIAPDYPIALLHGATCNWQMRATKNKETGKWRIVKWVSTHSCPGANDGNQSRNVTSRDIAALVLSKVRADIAYKVKSV